MAPGADNVNTLTIYLNPRWPHPLLPRPYSKMNKKNTRRAWRYVFVVAALLLAVAGFAVPEMHVLC